MAYNPGTALGSEWKNKFFLVEFVGTPSRSHVWSFSLKPNGASFDLAEDKDVVNGILPTGIRFGPDGALYVADWINGWGTKNYGRVWKLDVSEDKNDLKDARLETKRLMQLDYTKQTEEELFALLAYEDMRIRLKAQFELAAREKKGAEILIRALESKNQLARIHGVWGIGQLAAKDASAARPLVALLKDGDPEIVAQAAKVLGDIRYKDAGDQLVPLLTHENSRVQFFGAQALGRMEYAKAVDPLLKMIEKNNDVDVYLRHAGVLALSRIGKVEPMAALANNPNGVLRIAAVLVLRRMKSEKVALFLNDQDELIATDAARAINDDLSIEAALPALAATLNEKRFSSQPLLRRAINACLRVGGEKELDILIAFAKRNDAPADLRAEALATIGTWPNPSVLDRVDGRYRGKIERDPAIVISKVKANIEPLLKSTQPDILVGTSTMLSELQIMDHNAQLDEIMKRSQSAEVRAAMLVALQKLKYDRMEAVIKRGMEDKDGTVRTSAIGLLNELTISRQSLPGIVDPIFKKGTVEEQQQMLRVLGKMPIENSEPVLEGLINQLTDKKLTPAITLDLMEAVDSTHSEKLISKVSQLRSGGNTADSFLETLYGGNRRNGRGYFMYNSTGQCVRCHSIDGTGGTVGPPLTHIGDALSREELLRALIEPSARLSPGYGNVKLTLKDNQVVTGILMEESKSELIVKTADAEPLEVSVSRISKRENLPSGMPPMRTLMSKREIRDMIEFLSNLKK
jgi:putative heme-binding domain-containing protein